MRLQIAWALAHFLWEGAAIAVLLWILLQVLRDAKTRYDVCAVALALMCGSPVATLFWLAPQTMTLRETGGPILNTALPASSISTAGWFEANASWFFWLWMLGALVLLARAATAWWRARRLVTRDFEPIPGSVELAALQLALQLGAKRVQFRASARVASALVFGWLKPIVVLPVAALGRLTEAEIEALLAHELAHVIRCDFFFNLLQTIAECVLFYHPLVWWVSARMREERELCCDDIAVAVCRDEILYSRALLRLEELRMEPALAATGGRLAHRIRRLLTGPESGSASVLSAAPGLALVLLLGLSVALLAQTVPPEPPAPPAPVSATNAPPAPPAPPPPAGSTRSKTVYRAGGDVTMPRLLHQAQPEYTEDARSAHLEGRTFLSAVIDPEGIARDIKVVVSLDRGLDGKAIEAVRKWRFEPGRKNGKPVHVAANIEINFRLIDPPLVPPVAPVPPAAVLAPSPLAAPAPRVTPVPHVAPVPRAVPEPPEPAIAPEPPEPPEPPDAEDAPPAPPSNAVMRGVVSGVVGGIPGGTLAIAGGGIPPNPADFQRAELMSLRLQAAAERKAMADERAEAARARQEVEVELREDVDRRSSKAANDPESQKSIDALRRKAEKLARKETQKAMAEADEARQEMNIADRENQLANQELQRAMREADRARADADRMQQRAELKSETGLKGNSKEAELERRRRYAGDRFGGENTDCGKVYMHYGPPDEIESHPSQGKGMEIWRYKDTSRANVMLEIEFQDGKQVRRSGGFAADL